MSGNDNDRATEENIDKILQLGFLCFCSALCSSAVLLVVQRLLVL